MTAKEPLVEAGAVARVVVRSPREVPSWVARALRVPLAWKLVGATTLVVVAAVAAAVGIHGAGALPASDVAILVGSLGVALVLNLMLVLVALRPLGDLEETASRVWRGDYGARVPRSILADRTVQRVGGTLNVLLEGIASDRARLRRLAAEVIRAGDRERAHIARELHDSAAQSLAALVFQLTAAERENGDPAVGERMTLIRELAQDVLEEVRLLSHTVHPRVLDDLGLAAALRNLAREIGGRITAEIGVEVSGDARRLPPAAAAALYRVAQEAINNAVTHASAAIIDVRLTITDSAAVLEVEDDGRGFDVDEAERRRPGMGLFTMRERMGLVDGQLTVDSAPACGTRVRAMLPVRSESATRGQS